MAQRSFLFPQTLKACAAAESLDTTVLSSPPSTPYSPAKSACQISKSEAGPWEPGSGGGRDSLERQDAPVKRPQAGAQGLPPDGAAQLPAPE